MLGFTNMVSPYELLLSEIVNGRGFLNLKIAPNPVLSVFRPNFAGQMEKCTS